MDSNTKEIRLLTRAELDARKAPWEKEDKIGQFRRDVDNANQLYLDGGDVGFFGRRRANMLIRNLETAENNQEYYEIATEFFTTNDGQNHRKLLCPAFEKLFDLSEQPTNNEVYRALMEKHGANALAGELPSYVKRDYDGHAKELGFDFINFNRINSKAHQMSIITANNDSIVGHHP